jgi:hypothetical protein
MSDRAKATPSGSTPRLEARARLGPIRLMAPKLGSKAANHELDQLIHDYVASIARFHAAASRRGPSQGNPS